MLISGIPAFASSLQPNSIPPEPGQPFQTSITQSLLVPAVVLTTSALPDTGPVNLYQTSSSGVLPPKASEQIALGPFWLCPLLTEVDVQVAWLVAIETTTAEAHDSPAKPGVKTLGPAHVLNAPSQFRRT
jgi:hypothetical protein